MDKIRIRNVLCDSVLMAGGIAGGSCNEAEQSTGPYVTTMISERGERLICQAVAGDWGATVNGLFGRDTGRIWRRPL